ncbi:MAG: hypothetical protein ACI8TQ_002754 [Planctomycetota bacterium]
MRILRKKSILNSRTFNWGLLISGMLLFGCGPQSESGSSEIPEEGSLASDEKDSLPPGLWQKGRKSAPNTNREEQDFSALDAIGYSDGFNPATEQANVTVHIANQAQAGYNFYTSGHGPEVILMDMQGQVLHRWEKPIAELWPGREIDPTHIFGQYFRRALLQPNGDIFAVVAGYGLVKLDKDSNLIWSYDSRVHHDLELLEDGSILTLTRETTTRPDVNADEPVVEDFVVILNSRGEEQLKVSTLNALQNAAEQYPKLVEEMPRDGDLLHVNSVEMLDGRLAEIDPAFKKGNVLISLHRNSVVAVMDLDAERIVWAKTGRWTNQHHPRVLDKNRLLIYNNVAGNSKAGGKVSSILEYDLEQDGVAWSFRGNRKIPFRSDALGSVHRLANGNTLIIESQYGRALEVTRDKQLVWEFYSPHRAGTEDELVAVLLDVIRVPMNFPLDWLASER